MLGRCVFIALIATAGIAVAGEKDPAPVHYGGETDLDACGAVGEVYGLNPDGDGFLAVREGPSTKHQQADALHNGDLVFMCDETRDGKWIGIVYQQKDDEEMDCGTSSPIAERQAYPGPCRSGWVYHKWVRLIAG